jgi:hypothetical protein
VTPSPVRRTGEGRGESGPTPHPAPTAPRLVARSIQRYPPAGRCGRRLPIAGSRGARVLIVGVVPLDYGGLSGLQCLSLRLRTLSWDIL